MGKKNECYLCGAKLHHGYCRGCGLDNTKIHKKNYRLNESGTVTNIGHDESKMVKEFKDSVKKSVANTNVNRRISDLSFTYKAGDDVSKKSGSYQFVPPNMIKRTPKVKLDRTQKKTGSRIKTIVKLFVIVNILLVIISSMYGIYKEHSYQTDFMESIFVGEYEESEENDPYEYASRELSSDGDNLTQVLGAGEYVVGTHIPEGNYTITLQEGSCYFNLNDDENSIYMGESFGKNKEYDEVSKRQDVRLYQNAQFSISEGAVLEFSTDCAQSQSMTYIENPLTEQILVKQDETRIVGTDIPAGIYNVICQDGSVWLTYFIPANPEWYDEDYIKNGLWLDPKYGSESYSNLVLPEGTKISAEDGDLLLIPSERIASEDYGSHYPYYFYQNSL